MNQKNNKNSNKKNNIKSYTSITSYTIHKAPINTNAPTKRKTPQHIEYQ